MDQVLDRPVDGTRADLAVGDQLVLRLDQQSGGGHLWELSAVPDCLEPDADRVEPVGSSLPGSAHTRLLGLRASRPGAGELVLALRRPWEDEPTDERRIRIRVQ